MDWNKHKSIISKVFKMHHNQLFTKRDHGMPMFGRQKKDRSGSQLLKANKIGAPCLISLQEGQCRKMDRTNPKYADVFFFSCDGEEH